MVHLKIAVVMAGAFVVAAAVGNAAGRLNAALCAEEHHLLEQAQT